MELLNSDYIFNDSNFLSQIEKTAGHEIKTEYDLIEASLNCTPNDFSLFDADKNDAVSYLLGRKYGFYYHYDNCFQFDNGIIEGLICTMEPEGSWAHVLFTNCDDPDSFYGIDFFIFSIDEVREILGTIKFDDTAQIE